MRGMRYTIIFVLLVLVSSILIPSLASADDAAPVVLDMSPAPDSILTNATPTISASFYDVDGIDVSKTQVFFDRYNAGDLEENTIINESGFKYIVPEILKLKAGNHTVRVEICDKLGNNATIKWNITYDPDYKPPFITTSNILNILNLVYIIGGAALIILGIYILYLMRYKRFTFKKYFIRKPIKKNLLVIYIPIIVALAILLIGFSLVMSKQTHLGPYGLDYIANIALVVALLPFAIDSLRERKKKENYEKAFSQFLFELADAIRGGIDPAKAMVEFSKGEKTILKKQMKIAADGILMGRPFEDMLTVMVKPMKSDLIRRYASLIGEASKIGGDIAVVIHRAAQDLDELVKIEAERRRQLSVQGTTIYIAFGVLMIIVFQLVNTFSSLGGISLGGLTGGSATASTVPMDITTLKQNFYLVSMVLGISCGLLIGSLTDGKIRMGLIHAIGMGTSATAFFAIMIFK
jgi:pilus assembly protein TadC